MGSFPDAAIKKVRKNTRIFRKTNHLASYLIGSVGFSEITLLKSDLLGGRWY